MTLLLSSGLAQSSAGEASGPPSTSAESNSTSRSRNSESTEQEESPTPNVAAANAKSLQHDTPSDPSELEIEFAEGLGGTARRIRELYPELLAETERKLGFSYPRRLRVRVFRDHEAFSNAITEEGGSERPGHVAAVAFGYRDLIILKSRAWTGRQGETLRTIFHHELVHCFVGHLERIRPKTLVPLWLNEGLAQWASEHLHVVKDQLIEDARASGRVLALKDISRSFPDDEATSQLAYAQSLAIVRFIDAQRPNGGNIPKLLNFKSRGFSNDEALEAVIGMNLAQLEARWQDGSGSGFGLSIGRWMEFSFAAFLAVATLLAFVLQRNRRRRRMAELEARDRLEFGLDHEALSDESRPL